MVTRKAAPALAAGCTMVLKPAELTPLTALALAALAAEAGVPDGALEVIVGVDPAPIGDALCSSDAVRGLTFTGSTAVGKALLARCAPTVKKVSLELGGHAPFVVAADADVEAAALGAVASKFRNNGQTCVCANRILVHASVADAFADALVRHVAALAVGDGMDAGVDLGPLISAAALAKVETHVADALAHGAVLLAGGKVHARGGLFFEPTVLRGVTRRMRIWSEETFGPVAGITVFETDEEALALANDSAYGLAAYAYTSSLRRAFLYAEGLECGIVGVNEGVVATEAAPFGGVKESGLGREGAHDGIEEFLETKYVAMGGL